MRIFKDYSEEFEKVFNKTDLLQDVAVKNHSDIELVRMEIADLNKSVDGLKNIIGDLLEIIKKDTCEEEPVKHESDSSPKQDFRGLDLAGTYAKEFKYTEIDKDTYKFQFHNPKNNRDYHSNFTIFDILLIKGLENENTWNNWSDLQSMTGIRGNLLKKIAYNIKIGFFDKFIREYSPKFSKEYGLLYVDGKKTKVPIRTAKYIVECMTNSPKPFTTLTKLEKGGECSKLMYRVIGTSRLNSGLNSLFSETYLDVENNPQKRKEMGL